MFSFIVSRSLQNRLLVLMLSAIVIAAGLVTLRTLPVDVFPDLNRPTVTIMTEAEGLAPAEVEQLVTYPLETAMSGLPGLQRVRTVSGVGLSITYIEFDWGVDIYRARQQVNERLTIAEAQLPASAIPHMSPISSIMGEIMLIALSSDTASAMELREIADFVVRPQLLTLPGVSQVIPIGGEVRQYRVKPDLFALSRLGLTLDDMTLAVENFGGNAGGGFLDQHGKEYLLRNTSRTTRIEDLASVVVAMRGGRPITLAQVAEVGFAAAPRRGDAGYRGKPAVIVSVQKQPGANTVAMTSQIEEMLAQIEKTLPEGIKVNQQLFRQADFITTSVSNVQIVLIEAMVIVALVLFAFLLNWRTTFISLTAIPLSLLVTVLVFKLFGLSINTMTLGGLAIAIGELVDDAVVDVENIFRRLKQNAGRTSPRPIAEVVFGASLEVRSSIVYATLIVILVFVPLFALSGIEGRLFAPLGVAYIVSLFASLIVSISVTPVLCYYLLPKIVDQAHSEGRLVERLKAVNRRVLEATLERPRPILVVCGVAVLAATVAMLALPRSFLPPFNEGTYAISVQLDPGVSLAESTRIARIAEQLILSVPEVTNVGRRTGRAELDEHAEGVHSSEIDVDIALSERSKAEITDDIRSRLAQLPVAVNIGQPIGHRLDHMLSGVRSEIALKIYGDDIDTLRRMAGELQERLVGVRGLVDVQVEKQVRIPQIEIAVDHEKAATYGVSSGQLVAALERASNGRIVSQVIEGARRYDVVIRLDDEERTPMGLRSLLVETPAGPVALSQVADVREVDGPNQISRENGRRRIVVYANTDGVDPSATLQLVREIVDSFDQLPLGYTTRLEGQFLAQEQASRLIAGLSLISLALIFAVLLRRYRSVPLALIIMTNVPLALVGGVAALWIASQPLSVASLVGFVTLAGIATRNGILKVSHYLNLALHEGEQFGRDLVIRGSLERMTPVLMTALSAGFALIPLMIAADAPGKEILHPVAITIFGGLLTSTLLDAVLTPALFLRYGRASLERLQANVAARGEPASAY
jgi:HME family heavy-metal exporter